MFHAPERCTDGDHRGKEYFEVKEAMSPAPERCAAMLGLSFDIQMIFRDSEAAGHRANIPA